MVQVTKNELWYSAAGVVLLLSWFLKGREYFAPRFEMMPPIVAFAIYNIVFFLGIYLLITILTGKKNHLRWSLVAVMLFIGIDIIAAPYLVTSAGINTGVDYWYVSSDAAVASLFTSWMHPAYVVFATYIVVPLLLLFFIPVVLLEPAALKKMLTK